MNKLELEFRKDLIRTMNGIWTPSIHVENHLNPGVPDLSYVMTGDGYETGWLELKVVKNVQTPLGVHVEPSQHRWIEAHCARIPVDFLVAVEHAVYLVPGKMHRHFLKPITHQDLRSIATVGFQIESMRLTLNTYLRQATFRGRYGQE